MRNYRQLSIRKARRRGAALLEFALIATIFFTMLLGMIQFGLYQSTSNSLWNLSREGARWASVQDPNTVSVAGVKAYLAGIAPTTIRPANLEVFMTPTDPADRGSAKPVTVKLRYDMTDKIIFPLVGTLLKRPQDPADTVATASQYNYYAYSTMRVE